MLLFASEADFDYVEWPKAVVNENIFFLIIMKMVFSCHCQCHSLKRMITDHLAICS